jgi:hypothetical protein
MNNKNTIKNFDLPAYLHIPQYLYQDSRLEKAATSIAAFFCSLHNAGKEIMASTDYLCALAQVKKRQLYNILNQLEELKYISRSGSTSSRIIEWIYKASAKITLIESDPSSALECTSFSASAMQCTQLVQSSALHLCTPVHTYNKEDIKEYRERGESRSQDSFKPKVNPFENPKCIEAFQLKFENYDLSIEELFEDYSAKSTHGISSKGFLIWINNERIKEHRRKNSQDDSEFFKAGDSKRTPIQDKLGKINAANILKKLTDDKKKNHKPQTIQLIEQPKERRRIQYKKVEPLSFMTILLPEQVS